MTLEEFKSLPVGQHLIESCCSAHYYVRAIKVSDKEIEKVVVSRDNAYTEIIEFNPKYEWLEPVKNFSQPFEYFKQMVD